MGEEVTNQVIVERIDNFKDHVSETLKRIENQTTLTNGRVRSLERWRSYITGAIVVIVGALPYLIKFLGK